MKLKKGLVEYLMSDGILRDGKNIEKMLLEIDYDIINV